MTFVSLPHQTKTTIAPYFLYPDLPPMKFRAAYANPIEPSFTYDPILQQLLQGKRLVREEISYPLDALHAHFLNGYLKYEPSILYANGYLTCQRCGNCTPRRFHAMRDMRRNELVTYCRQCIKLGKVSEIEPLISWRGPLTSFETGHTLSFQGTLSPAQEKASKAIKQAICQKSDLLVWAVCGAGKTEMLYEGILQALNDQKTVLVATPRVDVVHELADRFKQVFQHTPIVRLYGGSKERFQISPLVVATTHQVLRFYRAFDVVIIDEVDAFPYSADAMLHYGVNQAKKEQASTIYVTATPDRMQQLLSSIQIPARYHRHPLPVPTLKWCGRWEKTLHKGQLPNVLEQWIDERLNRKTPIFLFVPTIDVLHLLTPLLQKKDERIQSVHAKDKDRAQKVRAFRSGEIPLLVTTTILERGVTIKGADVAVLGAEHTIFTESALVQIAGRVGRSIDHPTGDIVFFHYGQTKATKRSIQHIKEQNRKAQKQGLLKKEE